MSAILTLLKVIGILLLILLGILFFLIVIMLFCPISYRVAGTKESTTDDTTGFSLQMSARWLLGLFRLRYLYPKPGIFKVKLLCFTIYDSSKPPKNKVPDTTQSTKDFGDKPPQTADTTASDTVTDTEDSGSSYEDSAKDSAAPQATSKTPSGEPQTDTSKESHEKDAKAYDKTTNKRTLPDKLKHLYQEYCFYSDFWNAPETREILTKVINRGKRILRSVLPQKLEAELLIGTGEPDTTGYVMAVYGILLPVLGYKVNITPDFENQIIEGHFKANGHIRIFTLLKHALAVLLDKNLKIVYKRFKKHKEKVAADSKKAA